MIATDKYVAERARHPTPSTRATSRSAPRTTNSEVHRPIAHTTKPETASWLDFARHLVEMFLAMMAGMMVGAFLLATAVGTSVSEARREHAVAWVVVMAFDMTVPMVAAMLYRGHSWRSAGEMAAAMIVPALLIVACQVSHLVSGDVARAYMPVSTVAMIALIVYRRSEYGAAAVRH